MHRLLVGLTLAGGLLVCAPSSSAGEPAPSAREITPLLIGEKLPPIEVKTSDGAAFDLNAAVAKQPTILIVYRGGW